MQAISIITRYYDGIEEEGDIPIDNSLPSSDFSARIDSDDDSLLLGISGEAKEPFNGWVIFTINGVDFCLTSRVVVKENGYTVTQSMAILTLEKVNLFISELEDVHNEIDTSFKMWSTRRKILGILNQLYRLKENLCDSSTPKVAGEETKVVKTTLLGGFIPVKNQSKR